MNKSLDKTNRIVWIDYLRCIGLLLVVGAHVFGTSTPFLQLLFGCNVAIMVVVSGYCSVQSSQCSIREYYKKRGKQMIIRPWIFFIVYFLLIKLICIGVPYPYSNSQIIKTFLFMDGIGYTWIISVFIITAFVTPIIRLVIDKYPRVRMIFPITYWVITGTLFLVPANHSLIKLFLYVGGYIFLSFVGFVIKKNEEFLKYYLTGGLFVMCFCIVMIIIRCGDVFDFSSNKYPPTVYYITYGMIVSLILVKVLDRFECKLSVFKASKIAIMISKHSFDIYLWHIFGLYLGAYIENVWMKFIVVMLVAIIGAIGFSSIKTAVLGRRRFNRGV